MKRTEKYLIAVAWVMGIAMVLITGVHIAFLNPAFRPDGDTESGWIPLVGDVPIIVMILGWELPTAILILGGLGFQSRMPRRMGVALSLGVISFAVHLWYFPPVIVLAILVVAVTFARARRPAASQLPIA